MRRVGLIGGLAWSSAMTYYQRLNQLSNARHGGNVNPPLLLSNLNQAQVHAWQKADDWPAIAQLVQDEMHRLSAAGCEAVALCSNTAHAVLEKGLMAQMPAVPVLHIADGLLAALQAQGSRQPMLIGTRFTMTRPFLRRRLAAHGMTVHVPGAATIAAIQQLYFKHLSRMDGSPEAPLQLAALIRQAMHSEVDALILGCTEYPAALAGMDFGVPIIDSLAAHVAQIDAWIHPADAGGRDV